MMERILTHAAMLAGAFIGAIIADKIVGGYLARRDNGNFAKAEAEVTGTTATPEQMDEAKRLQSLSDTELIAEATPSGA